MVMRGSAAWAALFCFAVAMRCECPHGSVHIFACMYDMRALVYVCEPCQRTSAYIRVKA